MTFSDACGVWTREQIKLLREKAQSVYPGSRSMQRKWMRAKLLCSSGPKVHVGCAELPEAPPFPRGTRFYVEKKRA